MIFSLSSPPSFFLTHHMPKPRMQRQSCQRSPMSSHCHYSPLPAPTSLPTITKSSADSTDSKILGDVCVWARVCQCVRRCVSLSHTHTYSHPRSLTQVYQQAHLEYRHVYVNVWVAAYVCLSLSHTYLHPLSHTGVLGGTPGI